MQPARGREEAALVVAGMESADMSDAVERVWEILADEEGWMARHGPGYLRAMETGVSAA